VDLTGHMNSSVSLTGQVTGYVVLAGHRMKDGITGVVQHGRFIRW